MAPARVHHQVPYVYASVYLTTIRVIDIMYPQREEYQMQGGAYLLFRVNANADRSNLVNECRVVSIDNQC